MGPIVWVSIVFASRGWTFTVPGGGKPLLRVVRLHLSSSTYTYLCRPPCLLSKQGVLLGRAVDREPCDHDLGIISQNDNLSIPLVLGVKRAQNGLFLGLISAKMALMERSLDWLLCALKTRNDYSMVW